MVLRTYYQNVRGLRTKTDEFMKSVSACDYDVILLCETWLNDKFLDGEFFDDRYVVYRDDRDSLITKKSRGGGCLIAVKRNISSKRIDSFELGQDDIWVSVSHADNSKTFFNVKYIGCRSKLPTYQAHLNRINEVMNDGEPNSKFVLCGDYNLEGSITWVRPNDDDCVCIPTDLEGDIAHYLVEMQSLTGLNQFNYVRNRNGRSLDLVLSNVDFDCIKLKRSDFPLVVEDAEHHPALAFTVNTEPVRYINEKRSSKPNFFKADYLELSARLMMINWVRLFYCLNVNECLVKFNEIIEKLINELPKSTGKNKRYPCWYSKELIQLIGKKSKARMKKRSGDAVDVDNYKFLRRAVKQLISQCHDDYIRNTEDNLKTNSKCFFSYTKSIRRTNSLPSNLSHGNVSVSDKDSACNLFARFFSSVYQQSGCTNDVFDDELVDRLRLKDITMSESDVNSILSSFDCNKMSSPDDIPMIFYMRLKDAVSLPLSIIFNKSLSEGIFPELWKLSYISPIYKSGRKSDVTNYRPVSIICASAKIFEKLIFRVVFDFVKSSISSCQHGFFNGRSVHTNLVHHITFLCHNVMNGGQVDTIYTDFSKAFDMVDHRLLIVKLRSFGISGTLLEWFKSYLSNRSQCVVLGNSRSFLMHPSSGVPQGSVLGPLLFLIFVNDLVDQLKGESLQLADDLKISRKIESVEDCIALQRDIDALCRWCCSNKIDLNVKKCSVLTMTHKPVRVIYNYVVSGISLERVNFKKDLGVIFDEKLRFNEHIDKITRKAFQMLGFIFRSCKRFRNPESLITLYKAYVRSQVEYCSVVWSPIYQNSIDKIERVQRKFTRMLYRKFNWNYAEYPQRLERLKLQLLESRRYIADEVFLYKVVNGCFTTALDADIVVFNSVRSTRQETPTFYPPHYASNIESNSPVVRMQFNHNDLFNDLDIFNAPFNSFKSKVRNKYVM